MQLEWQRKPYLEVEHPYAGQEDGDTLYTQHQVYLAELHLMELQIHRAYKDIQPRVRQQQPMQCRDRTPWCDRSVGEAVVLQLSIDGRAGRSGRKPYLYESTKEAIYLISRESLAVGTVSLKV